MNRRNKIYVTLAVLLAAMILTVIGIYSILAMLFCLMLIILALGVLYQRRPDFFARFRRGAPEKDAAPGEQKKTEQRSYVPNLFLISETDAQVVRIPVDREEFTIGRDSGCNFVIDDATASRVHVLLRYDPITKRSFVTDQSSYGTLLNNRRLKRGEPTPLKQGDNLQITSACRFTVEQAHY